MKKILAVVGTMSIALSAQAGIFSQDKKVIGINFYDKKESKQLTSIVKDITNQEQLGSLTFNTPRKSVKTKFRKITFEKQFGEIKIRAIKIGNEDSIYTTLDSKHTEVVEKLFADASKKADLISSYSGMTYERGGITHSLRNIGEIKSITLTCSNEIYSDKSGGDSCFTRTENIDLNAEGLTILRDNRIVPEVNWNNSVFEKTNNEYINLAIAKFIAE